MERERLTQLLKAPDRVAREDLADLRALVARYPWFSGAQMLHASGEGLAGDVSSEETLNTAAAHVPSRAVLFDIAMSIEDGLFCRTAPPVSERPLTAADMPPENRAPIKPAHVEPRVIAAELVVVPHTEVASAESPEATIAPESVADVSESVIVIEIAAEVVASILPGPELSSEATSQELASLEPMAAVPKLADGVETVDPLERQIMEAALASAYDLTLHHPVPPSLERDDEKAEEPTNKVSAGPISELSGSKTPARTEAVRSVEPSTETAAEIPAKAKTIAPGTRKRFGSWLVSAPVATAEPRAESAPKAKVSDVPPKATAAPAIPTPAPVVEVPSAEERKTIVDRFIEQEIQPIAAKKEFFTPQQAAKRSLDDTVGLVTETLAGIYAKQGNIAKAKDAYRKLALKYPEKSAYFAGLLQTLEAQQNK